MCPNAVTVRKIVLKGELGFENQTLVTYTIEYPELCSNGFQKSLSQINSYYKQKAFECKKRCETTLLNMAMEQYCEDVENDFPVRTFEVMMVYQISYQQACVLSLYYDCYEYTGGAHGNTFRVSQTWNLNSANQVRLEQLVRCAPGCKTYILKAVAAQIAEEPELYFENYCELISETFDKNSFYCTDDGVVVYYQHYDIAPYSSGIREFLLPYSRCVCEPTIFCRTGR